MAMRHSRSISVLLISLAGLACSEAPAWTTSAPQDLPPSTVPPTPVSTFQVVLGPTHREVLVGDSLLVWAYPRLGVSQLPDSTLSWQSSDPSIAHVQSGVGSVYQIQTLRAGTARLTATSGAASASMTVDVLPIHVGAVPVAVEGFHVVEWAWADQSKLVGYSPVLALRDTANRNSTLVGLSFDVPGIGQSTNCYGQQSLGLAPWLPYPEEYGDYWLVAPPTASRTSDDAVAHLTVRLADGSGSRLDVHGPVVPGAPLNSYTSDGLSCQGP